MSIRRPEVRIAAQYREGGLKGGVDPDHMAWLDLESAREQIDYVVDDYCEPRNLIASPTIFDLQPLRRLHPNANPYHATV